MISFKIEKCDLTDSCFQPKRSYSMESLFGNLHERLDKTKRLQDPYYEKLNFQKIVSIYDIFKISKYQIAVKSNAQNISNAWLKMYELIHQFRLIKKNQKKVVHFDNAAFPGSFILAGNHYAKTFARVKNYNWYGSSWIGYNDENRTTGELLEDKYNMFKNYPNRWLMNKEFDGNVNDIKNQKYWEKELNHSVDLYTSDLGFETGENNDYLKQEYSHVQPNIGQVLAGLLTLKKGGSLVTKQYTFFESLNISLYAVLTNLFEEVYICKPITSRPPNSETYVIGKKYLGPFKEGTLGDKFIKLIENKIKNYDRKPLVYKKCLSKNFLKSIVEASMIFERQIVYMKDRLDWYEQVKKKPKNLRRKYGKKILNEWHNKVTRKWRKENPVYYLKNFQKIKKMKETLKKPLKKIKSDFKY